MVDFSPIMESVMVLSWTILAVIFSLVGVYMRAFSERSYPRLAWSAYLVVGGALLLAVTFRHEFAEAHLPYLEWSLLSGAAFFGAAFYIIATAYADTLAIQANDG